MRCTFPNTEPKTYSCNSAPPPLQAKLKLCVLEFHIKLFYMLLRCHQSGDTAQAKHSVWLGRPCGSGMPSEETGHEPRASAKAASSPLVETKQIAKTWIIYPSDKEKAVNMYME